MEEVEAKKNNKLYYLVGGLIIAITFLMVSILLNNTGTWVLTDNGLWVAQGEPRTMPGAVLDQQLLILAAQALYDEANGANTNLAYGPCLGSIGDDWVVDIAHNPRIDVDEDPVNQCLEYRNGSASHFVELDTDGNLIRIK
jgi:hypothetical protein